jgi:transposase
MESEYELKRKEIHRYCRISRFKIVLNQLMGDFGFSTRKSRDILLEVSHELPGNISYMPPCLMWDTIWKVLKTNKISNYYNRIPAILKRLKLSSPTNNRCIYNYVVEDFKMLDRVFKIVKRDMKRSYFPSLRFIALKLLQRHGYQLPINIPFARTPAKIKRLEEDYETLWNKVSEMEMELLEEFFNF